MFGNKKVEDVEVEEDDFHTHGISVRDIDGYYAISKQDLDEYIEAKFAQLMSANT